MRQAGTILARLAPARDSSRCGEKPMALPRLTRVTVPLAVGFEVLLQGFERGSIAGLEESPHVCRFAIRTVAHTRDANVRPVVSEICKRDDGPGVLPGFVERE